ncbi:MAG: hypothetical protein M1838_002652 [Thelocarpon superellum]|nr:MAG: hypothetical protein M1838_002652 [Thelocarpon superellum]
MAPSLPVNVDALDTTGLPESPASPINAKCSENEGLKDHPAEVTHDHLHHHGRSADLSGAATEMPSPESTMPVNAQVHGSMNVNTNATQHDPYAYPTEAWTQGLPPRAVLPPDAPIRALPYAWPRQLFVLDRGAVDMCFAEDDAGFNNTGTSLAETGTLTSVLSTYLTYCGGEAHFDRTFERPRFDRLRQAAVSGDFFYLVLHQLYCTSSLTFEHTRRRLGIDPAWYDAMDSLTSTLGRNDLVVLQRLVFMADYPQALEVLIHTSDTYRYATKQVIAFLIQFRFRKAALAQCFIRGCPPLADELVGWFGVGSGIVQRLLFRVMLMEMWGLQRDNWCNRYELIFRKSQDALLRADLREVEGRDGTGAYAKQRAAMIAQMQELRSLHVRAQYPNSAPPDLAQHPLGLASVNPFVPWVGVGPERSGPAPTGTALYTLPPLPQVQSTAAVAQGPTARGVARSALPPLQPSAGRTVGIGSRVAASVTLPPLQSTGLLAQAQPAPSPSALAPPDDTRGGKRVRVEDSSALSAPPPIRPAASARFPGGPKRLARQQPDLQAPAIIVAQAAGQEGPVGPHYEYVAGFAVLPQVLPPGTPLYTFSFAVDMTSYDSVPETVFHPATTGSTARSVRDGSLLYRLRCCKLDSPEESGHEGKWLRLPTTWPRTCLLDLNGTDLKLRRDGRSQALDLTEEVVRGQNALRVSVVRLVEESETAYALGVEVVRVASRRGLLQLCLGQGPTPLSEGIDLIKTELPPGRARMQVNVTDPSTGHLLVTPVRGEDCRHARCFDLDAYIDAHHDLNERVTDPASVTRWECPLCRSDARPHRLRLDGYMQFICYTLAEEGHPGTRRITFRSDGTWVGPGTTVHAPTPGNPSTPPAALSGEAMDLDA